MPILFFAPLLALLLGLSLVPHAAADSAATKRQVRQLQGDIKKLKSTLGAAKSEHKKLQQQLERVEVDAGRVNRQLTRVRGEVSDLSAELGRLKPKRDQLRRARQEQAQQLGEQLALAFRHGQQDKLKLLLNQEQPQRVSRMLQYHQYFTEARVEAIGQFNRTLDELERVESTLTGKSAELEARERTLDERRHKLQQLRASRQDTLAKLNREIKGQSRQLAVLEADRKRLQRVLRELQQALEKADLAVTTKRFSQLKGRLGWPTKGKVVQRFGSRAGGVQADGILISARSGQPVGAVHNGRVVYSDWLRGYGLLLIIDHGSGYMSLYGHNQSLLKEVGDWVAAGETVARVGDSGGQTKAGLYFAIRRKGKPQNPQRWLARNRG